MTTDFYSEVQVLDDGFRVCLVELGVSGDGVTIAAAKRDLLSKLRAWAEDRRTRPELAEGQDHYVSAILSAQGNGSLERLVFGESEL